MSKRDDEFIEELYQLILGRAHLLLVINKQSLKDPLFMKKSRKRRLGRIIANIIHDINPQWSGSASYEAARRKLQHMKQNKNYNPSKDHYNSRQRCGEVLVDLMIERFGEGKVPSFKEVKRLIQVAQKVHYVTSEENKKAQPWMDKGLTPEQAYKKAGIKLLHDTQDLFGRRGPKTNTERKRLYRKYDWVLRT